MTSHFGYDINKEDGIFGLAEASLSLYSLIHKVANYVRKAANSFIAFLAAIFLMLFGIIAIPALMVLFIFLSAGLIYSIIFFSYQNKRGYRSLARLDRKELIELHVSIRHTARRLESVKKSDLLFTSPIMGSLMRTYLFHVSRAEQVLKVKAYPNHSTPPKNPVIHDYDPSDPWQKDMSDLKRFEDLPTN